MEPEVRRRFPTKILLKDFYRNSFSQNRPQVNFIRPCAAGLFSHCSRVGSISRSHCFLKQPPPHAVGQLASCQVILCWIQEPPQLLHLYFHSRPPIAYRMRISTWKPPPPPPLRSFQIRYWRSTLRRGRSAGEAFRRGANPLCQRVPLVQCSSPSYQNP